MTDNSVVVTGGSAGIGLAIVRLLLAAGYRVINLARRPVPIDDPRITNIVVDLLDREAVNAGCAALSDHAPTRFVHNAGIIRADLLEDVAISDLDALNQIHLGAAVQIMQALLPTMKNARFGRVVIISSRASVGMVTRSGYAATKAGQIALARTWALELGEFGITVNTVAPGPIQSTEMFHEVVPEGSPMLEKIAQKIPVRRLGEPDDVAHAVMFFLAEASGFVTGQNLYVCGGTSIESG